MRNAHVSQGRGLHKTSFSYCFGIWAQATLRFDLIGLQAWQGKIFEDINLYFYKLKNAKLLFPKI